MLDIDILDYSNQNKSQKLAVMAAAGPILIIEVPGENRQIGKKIT
jgi:hypothetical protein